MESRGNRPMPDFNSFPIRPSAFSSRCEKWNTSRMMCMKLALSCLSVSFNFPFLTTWILTSLWGLNSQDLSLELMPDFTFIIWEEVRSVWVWQDTDLIPAWTPNEASKFICMKTYRGNLVIIVPSQSYVPSDDMALLTDCNDNNVSLSLCSILFLPAHCPITRHRAPA